MKRIDYKNIKNGLPYPSIIYGLCLNAGVGGAKHDTTKKCGAPINDKTIERYIVKEPEEEEEDEEEQDEPSLNEPLLCLQPPPGYDPATQEYIARCNHYLVGGYQHTQDYMYQQGQYGAAAFEGLNEMIGRWDINQENQYRFPPYPQYTYYQAQAPQWPPHMAPPQYPGPPPPPPQPPTNDNDDNE